MTVLEVLTALVLFAMTAGAVTDLWYQTVHATDQAFLDGQVTDLAETFAEKAVSGQLGNLSETVSYDVNEFHRVFHVTVEPAPTGGREVVVVCEGVSQTLYVSLPQ